MTICPKECPDRHPGCHDHCERYAENKAAYQKMKQEYDASHKQTVEMELETLIRKEERRFPEMQDSGSAKIIPVKVKFRETRSRIGIFEYLKEAIKNGRSKID